MASISIVIPTLNEERFLPLLLDSIQNQSFRDIEIIVADSGSSDSTRRIAREKGCRVVNTRKRGVSLARNRGAALASGDLICFIDADSILEDSEFLAKLMKEDFDCCTCRYVPSNTRFKHLYAFANFMVSYAERRFPLAIGSFIACRRDLHMKLGGFDETILSHEDCDYVLRASRLGKFRQVRLEITVSTRRFEKEGWTYGWKMLYGNLYRRFKGEIRKPLYRLEFGKF